MKYQVLFIPNIKDELDEVLEASGLMSGLLINCETDEKLMAALDVAAQHDHYVEVRFVKEDEPWPSRNERLGIEDGTLEEAQ